MLRSVLDGNRSVVLVFLEDGVKRDRAFEAVVVEKLKNFKKEVLRYGQKS